MNHLRTCRTLIAAAALVAVLMAATGCAGVVLGTIIVTNLPTPEKAWQKACRENTRQAYERFLQKYPESAYTAKAKGKLEHFDWADARRQDWLQSYRSFLEKYPASDYAPLAYERIETLRWEQTLRVDTRAFYQDFLKEYPNSRFAPEAARRLDAIDWERTRRTAAAEPVKQFLDTHPRSPLRGEALSTLLERLGKKVGLVVEQHIYVDAKETDLKLPVAKRCNEVLRDLGFQPVSGRRGKRHRRPEAVFAFRVKGVALGPGNPSRPNPVGSVSTGARMVVEGALMIRGRVIATAFWERKLKPPDALLQSAAPGPEPSSVPPPEASADDAMFFASTWRESGYCGLFAVLGKLTGDVDAMVTFITTNARTYNPWEQVSPLAARVNGAVCALGELGNDRAVAALVRLFSVPDPAIRAKAATELARIRNWKAVGPLIDLLEDDQWEVRQEAVHALWQITGENFGENRIAWLGWWQWRQGLRGAPGV